MPINRPGTAASLAATTADGRRLVYLEAQPDGRTDLLAAFEGALAHLPLMTR